MSVESRAGCLADRARWTVLLGAELLREILDQPRDVVAAVSQRRQRDVEAVEPVIQIEPERAELHRFVEVLVRRGDDSHIGRHRRVAAEPLELLLLKKSQRFRLRHEAHVADLIQKDCAAVDLLELADAALLGPGECSLLMPEQLAFEQRLRQRRAIDREERAVAPCTVLIDRPRDQFLAGPALAGDEHRIIVRGDSADLLVDLLHRVAAPNDLLRFVWHRLAIINNRRYALKTAGFDRFRDEFLEGVQIERLQQVVERTATHRFNRRFRLGIRGHQNHRHSRVDCSEFLKQVEPALVRQSNIEQRDIRSLRLKRLQSCASIRRRDDLHLRRRKTTLDHIQDVRFVIDDQNFGMHEGIFSWQRCAVGSQFVIAARCGSQMEKAAPVPATLVTVMEPSWASTMRRQMARPRPVPLSFVVANGSKIFSSDSGGIPGPLSTTSIKIPASFRESDPLGSVNRSRTETRRCPCGCKASRAFSNRFKMTCLICVGS